MDAMIKLDQHEKATHKTRETFEKYAEKCSCPAIHRLSMQIAALGRRIFPRIVASRTPPRFLADCASFV